LLRHGWKGVHAGERLCSFESDGSVRMKIGRTIIAGPVSLVIAIIANATQSGSKHRESEVAIGMRITRSTRPAAICGFA
jgi:hypothetical protein